VYSKESPENVYESRGTSKISAGIACKIKKLPEKGRMPGNRLHDPRLYYEKVFFVMSFSCYT